MASNAAWRFGDQLNKESGEAMKLRQMPFYETNAQGQKIKRMSSKWYAVFMDWSETLRRLPLLEDKKASAELARKIDRLNSIRAGGDVMTADLTRYVETMPPSIRVKLAGWGILSAARVAAGKPLTHHVRDYRTYLQARGRNPHYIKDTVAQLERIVEGSSFTVWSDISASRLDAWLNDLWQGENAVSDRTVNGYLIAAKSFCNWMVKDRRACESPLAHLEKRDEAQERRGPFTVEELRLLIATAKAGPAWRGITGVERALIYRLGAETGLRANEMRLLTRSAFHIQDDRPIVVAERLTTKGKKARIIGLRNDTAQELRAYLSDKMPTTRALPVPKSDSTSLMIYFDMERAGVPKVDENGRTRKFHSLRHTTGSFFNAAGVNPKVAQAVLGHSDINLTMGIYTHTYRDDEAEAIAALPDLSAPAADSVKNTGTDEIRLSPSLSLEGDIRRISTESGGDNGHHVKCKNPRKTAGFPGTLGNGVTVAQQTLDLLV